MNQRFENALCKAYNLFKRSYSFICLNDNILDFAIFFYRILMSILIWLDSFSIWIQQTRAVFILLNINTNAV